MLSKCLRIQVMGKVSAGQIKPLGDSISPDIVVPAFMVKQYNNPLAYEVNGNSLASQSIFDGDMIIVTKTNKKSCQDGDNLVIQIDGDLVLKNFNKDKELLVSDSVGKENNDIEISLFDDNVKAIGKVRKVLKLSDASPKYKKQKKLPIDQIIQGDAIRVLNEFPDNSIDLVVTSPPYDGLRDYKGFSIDLEGLGIQMHRVLKPGGIIGMVIQDQTQNFGKSLTSFRTIVNWCDNAGFKLFECLIYRKFGAEGAWWNKRFRVDHEYLPIFIKGERPAYFDKEGLKIPSKHGGKVMKGGGTRLTNGTRIATRPIKINAMKCRGTVWEYMTAGDGTRLKHKHPATFPDKLPYDLISCFCPPDGLVLDPMCGSGTSMLAAKKLDRKYIGVDIAEEYCQLARKRIDEEFYLNNNLDLNFNSSKKKTSYNMLLNKLH